MEVNNTLLIIMCLFFIILYIISLMNNYEQASKRIKGKYHTEILADQLATLLTPDHLLVNSSGVANDLWDKKKYGPLGWTTLHVFSTMYPDEPSEIEKEKFMIFLNAFAQYFPCKVCGKEFLKIMEEDPVKLDSRKELQEYLCQKHNFVNEYLKKPIFDCTKYEEVWGKPIEDCDTCHD